MGKTAGSVVAGASGDGVTIVQCNGHITTALSNAAVKSLAIGTTVNWTAGFIAEKYTNPTRPQAGFTAAYTSAAMASAKSYTITEASAMALAASTAAVAASLYTLHY